MKIYCVANQKGGIGKTTTATNLASVLKHKGYKTLLIDADKQCNSSDTFRAEVAHTATLYDVILDYDDPLDINEAIQHTEIGDVVASDPLLKNAETTLKSDAGEEYFRLKDALDKLSGYDYVVIDTAPANDKLLMNCLIASDEVIVPITADRYGVQGLADLHETIQKIKKRSNPNLKIAGLLMIKYKERLKLTRDVENVLEKSAAGLDTKLFKTKIRESTCTQVAQAERNTVANEYLSGVLKKSTTAEDYIAFTDELLRGE